MAKKKPKNFKPSPDWPKGHRYYGKGFVRCQKWAYNQERQCERLASKGLDCCTTHGAKSLKGKAHPGYKHGGFSKYAPKKVQGRILEAARDPELINLTEDAALATARLTYLLEQLEGAGGLESWEILGVLYGDLVEAIKAQDSKTIADRLTKIGSLIQSSQNDYRTWNRIQSAQEHKVKVVTAEHRRRMDMQLLLDRADLLDILERVHSIFTLALQTHIDDGKLYRRINADVSDGLRGLVSGNPSG